MVFEVLAVFEEELVALLAVEFGVELGAEEVLVGVDEGLDGGVIVVGEDDRGGREFDDLVEMMLPESFVWRDAGNWVSSVGEGDGGPADFESVGGCLDGVRADEGEIEQLMAVADAHLGGGGVAEVADEF